MKYYKRSHSWTHSVNTLCPFVIDYVLIVSVMSGWMHWVGPVMVRQCCTDKRSNICHVTCSLFHQSRLLICWHKQASLNPVRTTCQLVKMSIQAYIEQIREGVRKNSLICKFLMLCYQSFIMIGLTNEHVMILTNHTLC